MKKDVLTIDFLLIVVLKFIDLSFVKIIQSIFFVRITIHII